MWNLIVEKASAKYFILFFQFFGILKKNKRLKTQIELFCAIGRTKKGYRLL
jgi:hypothetical protein